MKAKHQNNNHVLEPMVSHQEALGRFREATQKELDDAVQTLVNFRSDAMSAEKIACSAVMCIRALEEGRRLLFAGNGGSAAEAQHMAAEYVSKLRVERRPLAAISLTTDTSVITSIANDYGYENLISRQLEAIGDKGDVLFLYTTSGSSENIIKAFAEAKKIGISTIGILGAQRTICNEMSDIAFNVVSSDTARVQEIHTVIGHAICSLVEKHFQKL